MTYTSSDICHLSSDIPYLSSDVSHPSCSDICRVLSPLPRPPSLLTFQYFWFHSISWSRFPRSWHRDQGPIFDSWSRRLILRIWISQWYHSLLKPTSITVDSGSTWKGSIKMSRVWWRTRPPKKRSFYKEGKAQSHLSRITAVLAYVVENNCVFNFRWSG